MTTKHTEPPYSIEAEQSVIGGMMLFADNTNARAALDKIIALGLTPECFYRRDHQIIFQHERELIDAGQPLDVITLSECLESAQKLDAVGGLAYLGMLAKNTPSAANICTYAGIVLERYMHRRIIALGVEVASAGYEPHGRGVEELLALAQQQVEKLRELSKPQEAEVITGDELLEKKFAQKKWAIEGIIPEGLTMLASKPKVGKSWMVLNICLAVASGGRALNSIQVEQGHALYISLEDPQRRLQERALTLGQEKGFDISFATKWRKLEEGGIRDIEAYLKKRPDTRIVVIDTLEKVRARKNKANGDAYAEDSAVGFMLTELAQKYPGLSLVIIHHVRKSMADDPLDTVMGSTGLTATMDAILILTKTRGQADAELFVTGKDVPCEGSFAMSFDSLEPGGPKVHWSLLGEADEYRYTDSQKQIIDLLKEDGPQTIKEVSEKCEMYLDSQNGYQAAKKQLWRMAKDGEIRRDGSKYALIDHGTEPRKPMVQQLSIRLEHIPETNEGHGVERGIFFQFRTEHGDGHAIAPIPVTRWQALNAISTQIGKEVIAAQLVQMN